jgi:hypothetical protein
MRRAIFNRNESSAKLKSPEESAGSNDSERLWRWVFHEDNILATRISFFFLAEAILVAIAATTVNTLAELPSSKHLVGTELFGLALALAMAGLVLTTFFWYIFKVNYHSVTILTARLRELDSLYKSLDEARQFDRQHLWYYRAFGRRGVNWVINNLLPTTTLLIWCIVASFAIAIFVSH